MVIGAAGGTVVIPFIGTAVGAVGGAAFGAAKGSVVGAIGGALWASADCLRSISKSDDYIMRVEEFTRDNPFIMDTQILQLDDEIELTFKLAE